MGEPGDLATLKAILTEVPEVADRLGLLPATSLQPPVYDETPRNVLTFAYTGGDGVHFSLLVEGGVAGNASPVVMTVPCASQPNRIVGRNLRHFLGLGRHCGFFMLEQLQYDYAGTVALLDRQALDARDRAEQVVLAAIADALDVTGWHDHHAVLAGLDQAFAGKLDVSA